MIERLLERLVKELGIVWPLVPTEEGAYVLEFEPDLSVSVSPYLDQSIRLFCKLAPLPEINAEEFLHRCMVGNLLGRETGGAALGIDDEEKNLCLSYSLPPEISYKEFRDAFEDFLNYADAWRREVLVFVEANGGSG